MSDKTDGDAKKMYYEAMEVRTFPSFSRFTEPQLGGAVSKDTLIFIPVVMHPLDSSDLIANSYYKVPTCRKRLSLKNY